MIKVNVEVNDDGFMKIEANGHTDSVICSAVSTLLGSQVRYLQELAMMFPDKLQVEVKEVEK